VPGGTAHWTFNNGNYISQSGDAAITISPATATVSVSGYTGAYDGTAHGASGTATGVGGVNLSGSLTLGASYTDVPGGTAHWAFNNGNYVAQSGDVTITIGRAPVTITSGITANSKVYDGGTSATLSVNSAVLSGVLPADAAQVQLSTTGYTATFDNAGPGHNIGVTVSGLTLSGGKAGDYSLLQPTGLTGDITPTAVTISGTVGYYLSYPPIGLSDIRVAGVTLNLSGHSTATTPSGGDGTYSLNGVPVGGDDWVTPNLTSDDPPYRGISSADLALIQAHILRVRLLDSPYKLLAADVNGSSSITAGDLAAIQRVVVGVSNTFKAGLWRFVPTNYVFSDPTQPWTAPTNLSCGAPVWDMPGQDFVAIKLGDVNNSWPTNAIQPAGLVAAAAVVPVQFQVSNHTPKPGETIKASISVANFQKATSAQFTLQWDPAVLQYVGTGDYQLGNLGAGSFGTQATDKGRLAFSWYDSTAKGVTLADGTTVFTVSFQVLGGAATVSRLALVDAPTVREVTEDFVETAFAGADGRVRVAGGDPVRVSGSGYTQGIFWLSVQTTSGWLYSLEYKDSINGSTWTPLPTVVEGDGTVQFLTDPGPSSQQRFYRVRAE
jgi:hypothetical protein